ncbi:MAG TPA: TetR/AcrR family transcriptional regulator [Holophaga sp.]|nr:TetR/AcrR family transcriptional regulator [Holophaga sp.]
MSEHPRTEDSRNAILAAAIAEFAERGVAGGRTESIARAAGVNKALIHYYFRTKEALYEEVLSLILQQMKDHFLAILEGQGSPGRRMLDYVLASFEHMAQAKDYSRILGHEMMRARAGAPSSVPRIAQTYFGPLHAALVGTITEGIRIGEFRSCDPVQAALSITGANVFYFMSAPVFKVLAGRDPRDPALIARRREAVLDLVVCLLFADRETGLAEAHRILDAPVARPSEP